MISIYIAIYLFISGIAAGIISNECKPIPDNRTKFNKFLDCSVDGFYGLYWPLIILLFIVGSIGTVTKRIFK